MNTLILRNLESTNHLLDELSGEFVVFSKHDNQSLYIGRTDSYKTHFGFYHRHFEPKFKDLMGVVIVPDKNVISDVFMKAMQQTFIRLRAGRPKTLLDWLHYIKNRLVKALKNTGGFTKSILRGYKDSKMTRYTT